MKNHIKKRNLINKIFIGLFVFISIIPFIPLFSILYSVVTKGIIHLNFDLFFKELLGPSDTGGGLGNALWGTIQIVSLACAFAIPISIGSAIYISQNQNKKIASWFYSSNIILQGCPSIIIGIVVYIWIVKPMGHFSLFSGGIALAIMMLPYTTTSCTEILLLIPKTIKEAGYALGAPYYKVILRIVLPTALPSMISGILVAVARIAGETAPLLYTAFGNQFFNSGIMNPSSALPLVIYEFGRSPYERWLEIAWAGSVVLFMFVLFINLITKGISYKWKVKF